MQQNFVVSHGGQELGPLSVDEIKQMLRSNQLLPIDYLYDEQLQDWILLSERFDLKALATEMGATQSPPKTPKVNTGLTAYPTLETEPPVPPEKTGQRNTASQPFSEAVTMISQPLSAIQPPADPVAPPPITTKVTTAARVEPIVASSAPEAITSQKMTFNGGVGTVSLKQLKAGRVVVKLQNCSQPGVQLPADTIIQVEPGPAKSVTWEVPSQGRAGDEIVVTVVTRDAYDNPTPAFSGDLEVIAKGKGSQSLRVQFQSGKGQLRFKWTVAEKLTLEVQEGQHGLALPAPRFIEIAPGPAARLIVESPPTAKVGENLPLTVRAVDQWGNLATDFKGEIGFDLVVDASAISKAS